MIFVVTITATATIMILDSEELCHPGSPGYLVLISMRKTAATQALTEQSVR